MSEELGHSTYTAMQVEKPYKRYAKSTLGKVHVTVLNPFSGKPEGILLEGDPANPDDFEKFTLNTWNVREDVFFRNTNKQHFKTGNVREIPVPQEPAAPPRSPNDITDDEIAEVLDKPFLALKNRLNKFTAVAPIYRLLRGAEDAEKSVKILDAIRARISELEFSQGRVEAEKPQEI